MTSKAKDNLHILFFPLMAGGHIIPTLDLAKVFATHGVTTTILTTHSYSPLIQRTINHHSGQLPIHLSLISFPTTISGLPSGTDSVTSLNSQHERIIFLCSLSSLRQPFKRAVIELRPDCIITDMFFPWTSAVARELQIPRLVFRSESFFSLCMADSLLRYKPHLISESFILPELPHPIKMSKSQILDPTKIPPEFGELFSLMGESEAESYGVVLNTFFELEPEYAKHYREFIGRRAWHVGPLLSRVGDDDDDDDDDDTSNMDDYTECLTWLDSKKPGSVVYVCFGSMFSMPSEQLRELAIGLEACEHPFIWVVIRMKEGDHEEKKVRVLEGGKGVVINGWAPQLVILNHPAVGAFITHCGWNSSMESICAGVPMITWPLFGDQFNNERLIVDVLKVGVELVGVKKFVVDEEEMELVKGEDVKKAVERMMGDGDEKESMRRRLRELGEMARRAVEEGGSSYLDLKNLIKELSEHDTN